MTTIFSHLNFQFHKSRVPTKHSSAQTRWENSNFIVHTFLSEHPIRMLRSFAMAFPSLRPTKLTLFCTRKCPVRQALLHGRQHGRRVHGPVLRLEATLRVCCRHHHDISWPRNFDSNEHHQNHCYHHQHRQHLHCHYHYHYYNWVSIHFHNVIMQNVTINDPENNDLTTTLTITR